MQDAWDLENTGYKKNRRAEYKSVEDQLDQLYHSPVVSSLKAVKDKYAKG